MSINLERVPLSTSLLDTKVRPPRKDPEAFYRGPGRLDLRQLIGTLAELKELSAASGLRTDYVQETRSLAIKKITSTDTSETAEGVNFLSHAYNRLVEIAYPVPEHRQQLGKPGKRFLEEAVIFNPNNQKKYIGGRIDPHRHNDSMYRTFRD